MGEAILTLATVAVAVLVTAFCIKVVLAEIDAGHRDLWPVLWVVIAWVVSCGTLVALRLL